MSPVFLHILKILGVVAAIVLAGIFCVGYAMTWTTQRGDLQHKFVSGSIPSVLPDGPYKGLVSGFAGTWRGKEFNRAQRTGHNLFGTGTTLERKYPFTTSVTKGLRDTGINVVKIDYDLPSNPGWLRLVTDEIVEIEPGRFLGKLHFRLIPGYPFALGYFELKKE